MIEDLHWIDTSSEEFLTFLLDAVAGVPLLLLVTYRIGYTPDRGGPTSPYHKIHLAAKDKNDVVQTRDGYYD